LKYKKVTLQTKFPQCGVTTAFELDLLHDYPIGCGGVND